MTKQAYRAVVLKAMPGTQAEIRERTGLSVAVVSRWSAALLDAGEVHLASWQRHANGGPFAMVYAPGAGRNAKPPKPMTDAERTRRMRGHMRRSGEWEHRKAMQRARYRADAPVRDPLTAALFGAA
jgi:hypothetical protein